jgi:hypothetical protein
MKKNILLIILLIIFLHSCSSPKQKVQYKEIDVIPLLNLNDLKPEFNVKQSLVSPFSESVFLVDSKQNIYFLDHGNHRIVVYSINGDFVRQIGSIGKDDESLFYPNGIFIDNDILYILDDDGQKLKRFTLFGEYLSGFKMPEIKTASSLIVYNNEIFIAGIYKNELEYDKKGLVSIYSQNGKKNGELGIPIPCKPITPFQIFNKVYFSFRKGKLFGAFRFLPVIFAYEKTGNKVFQKKLTGKGFEEVQFLEKECTEMKVDTPQKIKKQKKVRVMDYCYGFGVDSNNLYYALNYKRRSQGVIFCINFNGNITEKIVLKLNGKSVRIQRLYCNQKNDRYAVIFIDSKFYLIKF